MRLIMSAAAIVLASVLTNPAMAQVDCLASQNVDVTKSVTFLAFGQNAGDRLTKTMSCQKAEALRARLFASGQAWDLDNTTNPFVLSSKVEKLRLELQGLHSDLRDAKNRAAREIAFQAVKISSLSATFVISAAGCVTIIGCAVAAGAGIALYDKVESIDQHVGDLVQDALDAQAEIDKLISSLRAIELQLDANIVRESKLRYKVVFTEMCNAIKQQCSEPKDAKEACVNQCRDDMDKDKSEAKCKLLYEADGSCTPKSAVTYQQCLVNTCKVTPEVKKIVQPAQPVIARPPQPAPVQPSRSREILFVDKNENTTRKTREACRKIAADQMDSEIKSNCSNNRGQTQLQYDACWKPIMDRAAVRVKHCCEIEDPRGASYPPVFGCER